MNLIDAIKSGRPFRRRKHAESIEGCYYYAEKNVNCAWPANGLFHLSKQDILADDWEIQEPTVTITRSQFWEAVQAVAKVPVGKAITLCSGDIHALAYKLGLGSD